MESGDVGDQTAHLVAAMLLSTLPVVSTAECVGELLAINMEALMHLEMMQLVKQSIHTMSMELV